ncbi:CBP80/20-dependent translation initiation factor-like isoform X2 [Saccoglossus kowalevskii]
MSADTATGSPVASLRVIGRGRGFRNTSESIQTPLRRPNVGPVVEQSRLSLADITLKMQYLTLETVDEDGKQIKGLVERFSTSSTKLQAVVQSLYELALENYHYAAVAARLCHRMANVEVGETKFRNLVLKLLQADYEGRDILRGEGNDSYDACSLFAFVTFLVELYALLRTQNGEPLRALLTPVFVCLKELLTGLDNTEEEMEHCAREYYKQEKDVE